MENFTEYTIKDAIFNWAEAWEKVPLATLKNAWCKLMKTPKTPMLGKDESEGFTPTRLVEMRAETMQQEEWMKKDFVVPGCHQHPKGEIAEVVSGVETPFDEKEKVTAKRISLAAGLNAIDN